MEKWLRPCGTARWGSHHCSAVEPRGRPSTVLAFLFCSPATLMARAPSRLKSNNELSTLAGTEVLQDDLQFLSYDLKA